MFIPQVMPIMPKAACDIYKVASVFWRKVLGKGILSRLTLSLGRVLAGPALRFLDTTPVSQQTSGSPQLVAFLGRPEGSGQSGKMGRCFLPGAGEALPPS